ncbi:MAG: hypothetical protein OEP95_06055 [Myxococcales bacterium]|nr:hypothetical protein [Myxococcales bacterium]
MSETAVRDALAAVRAAGRRLRERNPEEILDALGDVLETWRDPASAPRRALVRELPSATGFSAPVIERGLELALAPWTREALHELWRREAGPDAVGFDTTAVLLAGAIPMPTLLALLAPLVLRSGVVARAASRDPLTAHVVAESLCARDAGLADALSLVEFDHDDRDTLAAFLSADCVVATGSDATVAALGAQTRGKLVSRGHRLSVAVLGEDADIEAAADALAVDVALWDQLGCLSPIAAYVVGAPAEARRTAEALAAALDRTEEVLPRGAVPTEAAAQISHERADAELRGAAGGAVALRMGRTWTVVAEADARPRAAPLHRFVRVHPVPDLGALADALAPYAAHLAALGCAGATLPHDYGASRICPLGQMQAPPLTWRQDGIGTLEPLVRPAR